MTVTIHWRSSHERGLLRWTSQVLLWAGCLALGFCALVYVDAEFYQMYFGWRFDYLPSLRGVTKPTPPQPELRVFAREGSPLSRLEIPRLAISMMVAEGIKPHTLARAAGHIPGTAFPDELGNVGIAGHRDTFFRKLSEVRRDDVITLTTPLDSYRYAVEWTRVVTPSDIEVLQPTSSSVLTLVTCYPFTYLGPAPQRFIVRARRLGS